MASFQRKVHHPNWLMGIFEAYISTVLLCHSNRVFVQPCMHAYMHTYKQYKNIYRQMARSIK